MKYKKYNNINVGEATLGLWDKLFFSIWYHSVPGLFLQQDHCSNSQKFPLFFLVQGDDDDCIM